MSIEVISAVLESDVGPTHKRFVLLALANNANKAGYCKPGVATLCGATGVARSTVFRILKELENEDGLLQRRQRRRKNGSQTSNAYRINVEALRARKRVVSDEENRELEALFDDDEDEDVSAGGDRVPERDPEPDQQECDDEEDPQQQGPVAGPPPSRSGTPVRPVPGPPEPSDEPSGEPRSLRLAELPACAPESAGTPDPVDHPPSRRAAALADARLPSIQREPDFRGGPVTTPARNGTHHPRVSRASARGGRNA